MFTISLSLTHLDTTFKNLSFDKLQSSNSNNRSEFSSILFIPYILVGFNLLLKINIVQQSRILNRITTITSVRNVMEMNLYAPLHHIFITCEIAFY